MNWSIKQARQQASVIKRSRAKNEEMDEEAQTDGGIKPPFEALFPQKYTLFSLSQRFHPLWLTDSKKYTLERLVEDNTLRE